MSKFSDNAIFCINCLLHDHFFGEGGSHISDRCPVCKGTETILWKDMDWLQRKKARKITERWTKEN